MIFLLSEHGLTCYFRHLKEVFRQAGISVTTENRKEIDNIIQQLIGLKEKPCPEVWREVKKRINENKSDFAEDLKFAWENRNRI